MSVSIFLGDKILQPWYFFNVFYRRESRRRSTLNVPRRQSVVSRRSSIVIDDRHLSTATASNNIDEILKAEDLPKINTFRIFSTNSKEWHYILMGSLASVVMGASMPVYAFLFGEVLPYKI